MTVANGHNPSPQRRGLGGNAILWMAVLSLFFHLLVVAALVWVPVRPPPQIEEAVPVELAQEEPAPPPPAPPPPAPKPQPKPEPPAPAETAPPPLPKPQLTPGKLAEKPKAGEVEKVKPAGQPIKKPTPAAPPKVADDGPGEEPQQPEYKGISGPGAAEATQSARDMLLAGIFQHFGVQPELRGRGLAVRSLVVTVMPNGMLAAPYDGSQPSDPSTTSRQYSALPKGDPRRRLMEEFDRAIRAAQPFHLSPALVFRAPFSIRLDFRVDDVP